MNSKNKKIIVIVIVVCVVLLLVGTILFFKNANNNKSEVESMKKEAQKNTALSPEKLESITNNVTRVEDYVEPGKNTLEVDKIQGFTTKKSVKNSTTNQKDKKSNKDDKKSEKVELSDSNLIIEKVGSYTGNYLEDGSDEPIEKVAAIIISNTSDKMLQVGDITFKVSDKENATFRVTNLLPHTSALVLESNKRKYSDKDDYSYGNVVNAYLDAPDLLEDKFEVIKENGNLKLKNKTDKTYKKVYVYYKYVQSCGAFMGGITYRVPFENIEGKKTVTSVANHFSANTSVIVDVQIAEE